MNIANEKIQVKSVIDIEMSQKAFSALKLNSQWSNHLNHLDEIRKTRAKNGGEGIKVAILDTGIDYDHPDLEVNVKGGISFVDNSSNFNDKNSHGTHCSGIIGAIENDIGVTGVAPKCELYGVKILGDDGSGSFDDIAKGVRWCIDNKIRVLSMSLGGAYNYKPMHMAIKNAVENGMIIVSAAGNEDDGNSSTKEISYPGYYPEVIQVAANDKFNHTARFSNDNKEVDISGPGVDIFSTLPNGRYGLMSGTSMACPFIAGIVALMLGENPDLSKEQVEEYLYKTAKDFGKKGRDDSFGWGIVNPNGIFNALV